MKALIEGQWHPEVRDRAAYEAARAAQPADLFRGRLDEDDPRGRPPGAITSTSPTPAPSPTAPSFAGR